MLFLTPNQECQSTEGKKTPERCHILWRPGNSFQHWCLCCFISLLWPPCIADADVIFLPCGFFFFSLAQSQQLQTGCLPYFHTWCGLSANVECRSEMCCTRLAGNAGSKKFVIWTPSHNFVGLYLRNQDMYRQSEKKLVKQQNLLHMSRQYGQLRRTNG